MHSTALLNAANRAAAGHGNGRPARAAFSLIEVLVGLGLVAILFVSMYVGFTSGFGVVQLSRENQRATQILLEKMETLRLYSWDQITTSGFIPSTFTAPFYATNNTGIGMTYTGLVTIASAPMTESYSNDIRLITVQVGWISGTASRTRTMNTFVSRYGLQNYIY
ncbi:MAG: type IV pilus modification PilV family protein [Limisphaerales bacterium]